MQQISIGEYGRFDSQKSFDWGAIISKMTFSHAQPGRLWFDFGPNTYLYVGGEFPPVADGVNPVGKYQNAKITSVAYYDYATADGVSVELDNVTLKQLLNSKKVWDLIDKDVPLYFSGGFYADKILGGNSDDSLSGMQGDDSIKAGAGNDNASGGNGKDTIDGGSGDDTLYGENGNDILYGRGGDDYLHGGAGNDILIGGTGPDLLYGDTGTDIASYTTASKAVIVDLNDSSKNSGDAKGDEIYLIEGLIGSSFNDTLTGNSKNNTIDGASGNDTIIGGSGADALTGGAGLDTASYEGAKKGVVANLSSSVENTADAKGDTYFGIENLTGSSLSDTLFGDVSSNKLSGGLGDDTLYGGLGNDLLVGGLGKDVFVFDSKINARDADAIEDFSVNDDTIALDHDIFAKTGKVGDLTFGAFHVGVRSHDNTDRIIYDSKSGKLWYDDDGTGSHKAIQFATLDAGLDLKNSNFDILG